MNPATLQLVETIISTAIQLEPAFKGLVTGIQGVFSNVTGANLPVELQTLFAQANATLASAQAAVNNQDPQ